MRDRFFAFGLLGPYLVTFCALLVYPIGRAIYMSFFDWGIFGPNEFIWLGNYIDLFTDSRFWRVMGNTIFLAAMYVPLTVIVSMVLAVLLHKKLAGIPMFRTVFFLPIVVNVAVAAIAVGWVIDPEIGMLNRLLALVGLPGQSWLNQPGWAMFAICLVMVWANAGFNVIIFMAGLENIPDELYEAARLDGSGPVQNFYYITAPLLKPITLLITILSLVLSLQIFGEVLLLTGGGPFGSTTVLVFLLYEEGFQNFELGRAAAIGVIMTVLIATISFAQFRIFREN